MLLRARWSYVLMSSSTLFSNFISTLQPPPCWSPFMKPFHNLMPISIISNPLLLCWRTSSYATEHRIASFLNSEFIQSQSLPVGLCDESVWDCCMAISLEQHEDSLGALSLAFSVEGGSVDGGKREGRKNPNSPPDSWNGTLDRSSTVGESPVR